MKNCKSPQKISYLSKLLEGVEAQSRAIGGEEDAITEDNGAIRRISHEPQVTIQVCIDDIRASQGKVESSCYGEGHLVHAAHHNLQPR